MRAAVLVRLDDALVPNDGVRGIPPKPPQLRPEAIERSTQRPVRRSSGSRQRAQLDPTWTRRLPSNGADGDEQKAERDTDGVVPSPFSIASSCRGRGRVPAQALEQTSRRCLSFRMGGTYRQIIRLTGREGPRNPRASLASCAAGLVAAVFVGLASWSSGSSSGRRIRAGAGPRPHPPSSPRSSRRRTLTALPRPEGSRAGRPARPCAVGRYRARVGEPSRPPGADSGSRRLHR